MCLALCMANSVDPDQTPHSVASDLGLHCLHWPICPNTWGYYSILKYRHDNQLNWGYISDAGQKVKETV